MELVRDVLDKQLVDRHGAKMGRADGIVVELQPGLPPKVIAIETGSVAMARRISERAGRWIARLAVRIGGERYAQPYSIPWTRIRRIEVDIKVDADVHDTPLGNSQRWLRDRIVEHIPGAS